MERGHSKINIDSTTGILIGFGHDYHTFLRNSVSAISCYIATACMDRVKLELYGSYPAHFVNLCVRACAVASYQHMHDLALEVVDRCLQYNGKICSAHGKCLALRSRKEVVFALTDHCDA